MPVPEESPAVRGHRPPLVLALETSCDETAACLFRRDRGILAHTLYSQVDLHRPHGGVVPEAASRDHLQKLPRVFNETLARAGCDLAEVDLFAATSGPGLSGALLMGMAMGKGLALSCDKPFLAVNHMEGHLYSPFLAQPEIPHPFMALIVSGGHTMLVLAEAPGRYQLLGATRDDAAGEAFDKAGKMLGLPYPGGPEIEKTARSGDPSRFKLPRSLLNDPDFSFSGLKTALRYLLPELKPDDLADACASFQEAVVDALATKTEKMLGKHHVECLAVSGGVACNQRLRTVLESRLKDWKLYFAAPEFCTDNAAMIAHAASLRFETNATDDGVGAEVDPHFTLAFSQRPY